MMNSRWMRVAGLLVGLGVCGAAAAQDQRPEGRPERRPGMNRPEGRPEFGPQERGERPDMGRGETQRRGDRRPDVGRGDGRGQPDERGMRERRMMDDRRFEGRSQGGPAGRGDRRGPREEGRDMRGPGPRREVDGPGPGHRGPAFQGQGRGHPMLQNPEFRKKVKKFQKNHPQARERLMERFMERREQMGPQFGRGFGAGPRAGDFMKRRFGPAGKLGPRGDDDRGPRPRP